MSEPKPVTMLEMMVIWVVIGAVTGVFSIYFGRWRDNRASLPIAVSERLPDSVRDDVIMNFVLVFNGRAWTIARWCPQSGLHEAEGFYDERDYLVNGVTHWQELPPAPH